MRPQFTPGMSLTSPGVQVTQRTPQIPFIDPVEHEGLKSQIQDLTEKLETMKSKYFTVLAAWSIDVFVDMIA